MFTRKHIRTSRDANHEILISRERRLELINKVSMMHETLVETMEHAGSTYAFQIIIAFNAYVIFCIMSLFALFNGFISSNAISIRNAAFMMNWNFIYTIMMIYAIFTCSSTAKMV